MSFVRYASLVYCRSTSAEKSMTRWIGADDDGVAVRGGGDASACCWATARVRGLASMVVRICA
ncbi:hypothetical protein [Pandoraea sputorum]|uniref:hypothetical protein n=1 Tax=Pandoraea sputorum TaxID=93222 RepID=UPI0017812C39|nr:hypothetical protein [Pandoraea sputorum]